MRCLLVASALTFAGPAWAQECQFTPFDCEVARALELALDRVREAEAGTGRFEGVSEANFLAMLAVLERSHRPRTPALGYLGASPEDQARLQRWLRAILEDDPSLNAVVAPPRVYVTGGNLAALSAYVATGGPDLEGARPIVEAMVNGVRSLQSVQGEDGGWSYSVPGEAQLSTTLHAVLGLSAAENIIEGAAQTVPLAIRFLRSAQLQGGGGRADHVDEASAAATAALLWSYRLAGLSAGSPEAQAALGWLHAHYTHGRIVGPHAPSSNWFYFWATIHALTVSEDDGEGGALYAGEFGTRDPAALGYPQEPPSAWFDVAYTLLCWQDPAGWWGTGQGGSPVGWTPLSSHLWAILALRGYAIGGCHDPDGDDLCSTDDNCPWVPNPDQADADEDGLGDLCDPPDAGLPDAAMEAPRDAALEPPPRLDAARRFAPRRRCAALGHLGPDPRPRPRGRRRRATYRHIR